MLLGLFTQRANMKIMTSVGRLLSVMKCVLVLAAAGFAVSGGVACAADMPVLSAVQSPASTGPSNPSLSQQGGAVAAVVQPTNAQTTNATLPALPGVVAAQTGGTLGAVSGAREGSIDQYQEKASGTIKEISKKLEFGRENVTLRDLNDARQAVIKIDAIIELEKKLAELEKVKKDKEKEKKISILPVSDMSLLPAPPKPALPAIPELPVTAAPAAAPAPVKAAPPPEPKVAEIEVSRVIGGAGKYRAVASVDGNEKVLRVGDKVSGGAVVTAVTAQGVEVIHKGEKKLYAVKNVGVVFGGVF